MGRVLLRQIVVQLSVCSLDDNCSRPATAPEEVALEEVEQTLQKIRDESLLGSWEIEGATYAYETDERQTERGVQDDREVRLLSRL